MITSQNRPGLPDFSRVTLKNMGRPGDEAKHNHMNTHIRAYHGMYHSIHSTHTVVRGHQQDAWSIHSTHVHLLAVA